MIDSSGMSMGSSTIITLMLANLSSLILIVNYSIDFILFLIKNKQCTSQEIYL